MGIGKIVMWLFIFIVGSLLVTFIVSPNNFNSVGSTINNIIKPAIANVTQKNTYVTLIPSQMQEYTYIQGWITCSSLEANGQANGVSDAKSILCEEACGKRNMNYGYYNCDKDLLTCYCSP